MLPGERAAGSVYTFTSTKHDTQHPRPHSSGFRTFLNWFKRVEVSRRESERPPTPEVDSDDGDSSGSETSTATASSFAFLPPAGYRPYGDALTPHKFIASGPYTETYRRRVADREKRRRLDNGVTLRKKYNLHGADTTLTPLRETHSPELETKNYDTFSLPAMSKRPAAAASEHRRAASESKFVRPTSYVHVKGKRRAPQPPTDGTVKTAPLSATLTRRVKRLAPQPPVIQQTASANTPSLQKEPSPPSSPKPLRISQLLSKKVQLPSTFEPIFPVIQKSTVPEVLTSTVVVIEPLSILASIEPTAPPIAPLEEIVGHPKNDSPTTVTPLASPSMNERKFNPKKPILLHSKSEETWKTPVAVKENGELSPRPWYKRQFSENKTKSKAHSDGNKNRGKPELPEIGFFRYSKIFESKKNSTSPKSENKRLSGPHALPNISELDREAAEILQMHKNTSLEENNNDGNIEERSFANNPRSARLLICKFNELNKEKPNEDLKVLSRAKTSISTECKEIGNTQFKPIAEECKLKSGNDTWVCMRCEKRNNCKKIICSSCFSRKSTEDDPFSRNIKADLLQSFESEVLDALSHLGKMGGNNQTATNNDKGSSAINITKETVAGKVGKKEESQELRQILREMKNSLPKLSKNANEISNVNQSSSAEASTSCTGAVKLENKTVLLTELNANKVDETKQKSNNPGKTSDILNKIELKVAPCIDNKHVAIEMPNETKNIVPILSPNTSTGMNKTPNIENSLYVNIKVPLDNKANPSTTEVKNPKLLLKELEAAIGKGDDKSAAEIAVKLAQMKINCTVLSSMSTLIPRQTDEDVTVEVYIEDAESAAGPVQLRVSRTVTLPQLRDAVQRQLDIPATLQRWIIGKQLCVDDAPLSDYNGGDFTQPLFLYLVAPVKAEVENKSEPKTALNSVASNKNSVAMAASSTSETTAIISIPTTSKNTPATATLITNALPEVTAAIAPSTSSVNQKPTVDHYQQLVQLENQELIANVEPFTCGVCLDDCASGAGIILRECLHTFCRSCLADTVRHCDIAQVLCPHRDANYSCESAMQEREVRALVSEREYERHLAKSIQLAESNMRGTFHCKTADCKGWCVYENTVNIFRCPICRRTNCLTCQVIHEGENCAQYQDRLRREAEGSGTNRAAAERTRRMLEEMCLKGDALECPSCQIVLMKKWGCDWVRCSMCKTEICWVTRGARWGPAGKGDTSSGCRCGVNGVKCHPSCNYCH